LIYILSIKVDEHKNNNLSIVHKINKYGHAWEHVVNVKEVDHISYTCMKFVELDSLIPYD